MRSFSNKIKGTFASRFKICVFMLIVFSLMINSVVAQINSSNNDSNKVQEFTGQTKLSNIIITIPVDYQQVNPGEEVLASIKLMNLGGSSRMDVILNFEIKDSKNKSIITKKETIAIETQANVVRIFEIPQNAQIGKYSLHTALTYSDGIEVSSEASFIVEKDTNPLFKKGVYVFVGIIILSLIILVLLKAKKLIEMLKLRTRVHRIVKSRLKK